MRAIILAALAAVIFAGVALAEEATVTPLWTAQRLYPYAGVEQRWTFMAEAQDRSDLVWHVGCAYSLGAFAPSVTWRWNPETGGDTNEFVLGLRYNLRGLFD